MASAAVLTALSEPPLIPGEEPDTDDAEDARQWITIYRELVTLTERTLKRLRQDGNGRSLAGRRRASSDVDERRTEKYVQFLQSRLQFWEQRFWQLAGLDLDVTRRLLNHGGHRLRLTRREAELLGFLAQRPGQFYSALQLVNEAWGAPELSPEQLRTYIVRLRRHLASSKAPARLVSEPRRGYGLVFSA